MDIKELFQSIFDSSNERIKNPLIGSYITAFILYNWRAIFLLIFSSSTIEDKIVVINHEYCCKEAILWPLAIAIFYILILPHLNLIFDSLLSYSNSKKNIRQKAGIISKLEQKKAEAKYEREIAEERAGTSEITELKNQIERLTSENNKLSEQNKETFERYDKSIEINKKNEENLVKNIEKLEIENKELKNKGFEDEEIDKRIRYILDILTAAQINYFIEYSNFKLSKGKKSVTVKSDDLDKFVELGLLFYNNSAREQYTLTHYGKRLNIRLTELEQKMM